VLGLEEDPQGKIALYNSTEASDSEAKHKLLVDLVNMFYYTPRRYKNIKKKAITTGINHGFRELVKGLDSVIPVLDETFNTTSVDILPFVSNCATHASLTLGLVLVFPNVANGVGAVIGGTIGALSGSPASPLEMYVSTISLALAGPTKGDLLSTDIAKASGVPKGLLYVASPAIKRTLSDSKHLATLLGRNTQGRVMKLLYQYVAKTNMNNNNRKPKRELCSVLLLEKGSSSTALNEANIELASVIAIDGSNLEYKAEDLRQAIAKELDTDWSLEGITPCIKSDKESSLPSSRGLINEDLFTLPDSKKLALEQIKLWELQPAVDLAPHHKRQENQEGVNNRRTMSIGDQTNGYFKALAAFRGSLDIDVIREDVAHSIVNNYSPETKWYVEIAEEFAIFDATCKSYNIGMEIYDSSGNVLSTHFADRKSVLRLCLSLDKYYATDRGAVPDFGRGGRDRPSSSMFGTTVRSTQKRTGSGLYGPNTSTIGALGAPGSSAWSEGREVRRSKVVKGRW